MQTTRSNVSRMLTAARERGVVQIRILDSAGRDHDLEEQLMDQFGLSEALVARFEPGSHPARRAGELGASWLVDKLRDGQKISLSWGTSLQNLVWAVTADHSVDVEILQLVGGLSPVSNAPTGQELLRELALRLGAHYRYLHAPAVLDRPDAVTLLARENSIAESLERSKAFRHRAGRDRQLRARVLRGGRRADATVLDRTGRVPRGGPGRRHLRTVLRPHRAALTWGRPTIGFSGSTSRNCAGFPR